MKSFNCGHVGTHHEEYEVWEPAEDEGAHDDPELRGGLLLLGQHRGLAPPRPATLLPQPRAPGHGALVSSLSSEL